MNVALMALGKGHEIFCKRDKFYLQQSKRVSTHDLWQ